MIDPRDTVRDRSHRQGMKSAKDLVTKLLAIYGIDVDEAQRGQSVKARQPVGSAESECVLAPIQGTFQWSEEVAV